LSPAIAEKVLLRSLVEIDALVEVEVDVAVGDVVGVVELVVLLLLHAAAPSTSAVTAAAVSPAFADTEYNGVPRLFSRDMPPGMCETRSVCAGPAGRALLTEIVGR
jgi:hypothetical protein